MPTSSRPGEDGLIVRVDALEDEVGAAPQRHRGGRLLEDRLQLVALVGELAVVAQGLPLVLGRGLRHRVAHQRLEATDLRDGDRGRPGLDEREHHVGERAVLAHHRLEREAQAEALRSVLAPVGPGPGAGRRRGESGLAAQRSHHVAEEVGDVVDDLALRSGRRCKGRLHGLRPATDDLVLTGFEKVGEGLDGRHRR